MLSILCIVVPSSAVAPIPIDLYVYLSFLTSLICFNQDSNLSIFAALQNPNLRLHALSSILPEAYHTP